MYAKIEGNSITHYPYGRGHLKRDHPNTSFPKDILKNNGSAYNVVEISPVEPPESGVTLTGEMLNDGVLNKIEVLSDDISEGTPVLVGDVWTQNWVVTPKTSEQLNDEIRIFRLNSYGKPEDQLEFITENGLEAWQAKVAEIKAQNPKV